jgi:hypothetical protein
MVRRFFSLASGYPLQPHFLAVVRFAPHHQKNGASAAIPLARVAFGFRARGA